jgi:hypothetical protein
MLSVKVKTLPSCGARPGDETIANLPRNATTRRATTAELGREGLEDPAPNGGHRCR